ncbi:MAG: NAD-dependent succinate-semialdehyde dehydrogenase [Thermodesulfobacteriota bacterium]|nr:NAD-dependent succinate-semialdehyde dehydrogenase [Thermodesulfobacteriota bacterium]
MMIQSINPATGELIKEYKEMTAQEVDDAVNKAHEAFLEWRKTGFAERAELMKKAARILLKGADDFSALITQEMGKPVKDGRKEVEKCAMVCEYYAENAGKFLKQEIIDNDTGKSFITFNPLGVLLAVMPWNFPFWQVFRFSVPAIMAGNACILKHASNVSGCGLAIEEIFRKADFPENLFRTLVINSSGVGAIIENPLVKAVTLTGSSSAGRELGKKAGEMLKKIVLELGGSDPYVILKDADMESAVHTCVASRLINSGQTCISAKRFIVVESIREEFEKLFVEEIKRKKMGVPMEEDTIVGPLARDDLRANLHRQVVDSIKKGARCLVGGKMPDGRGFFYPPTVLADVQKGMPAYHEELFGPVAAIISVNDEKEAIKTANDSVFGLGAAVFTRDIIRGEEIAAYEFEAGSCFVNDFVRSDPRLPFGGIKESGYGRELSHYGIKEFVNIKTVFVKDRPLRLSTD